jgi:hypothetical protein
LMDPFAQRFATHSVMQIACPSQWRRKPRAARGSVNPMTPETAPGRRPASAPHGSTDSSKDVRQYRPCSGPSRVTDEHRRISSRAS